MGCRSASRIVLPLRSGTVIKKFHPTGILRVYLNVGEIDILVDCIVKQCVLWRPCLSIGVPPQIQ